MLAGTAVMQTLELTYRRYRAELYCHMTRVVSVSPQDLSRYVFARGGDALEKDWRVLNPVDETPTVLEYELFLRQQYLKHRGKS